MSQVKIKKQLNRILSKEIKKSSNDNKIHLFIHSESTGVDIKLMADKNNGIYKSNESPYYIASVGKLFTAVLIGILTEKKILLYDDLISKYLEKDLLRGLHVYKEVDYSNEIRIKELLNQTSGLYDHWAPLLEKILSNPNFQKTPKEIIEWSKDNLNTLSVPGKKFNYSDTNYHLLGLIIEKVTQMPLYEAMKDYIFDPLHMNNSYYLHFSEAMEKNELSMDDFYIKGKKLKDYAAYANIDYAGGGIVSTSEDLLKFMKALVKGKIIKVNTFEKMKDWQSYGFGIDYGYGLMRFKTVPILMPKKFNIWGHAGATGAFMFYHPEMATYLIGTFNDFDYEKKSIRVLFKVINKIYQY